uniref:Uncharacterized protein n=1 Tax=Caenorhabditis tropicalis TaxID=1561998 RepID=A0A1I7UX57_9PELO
MADDGYEVMGPAHGPTIPPPSGPPPPPGQKMLVPPPSAPPMAVVLPKKAAQKKKNSQRSCSDTSKTTEPTTKRSVLRSVKSEADTTSVMENADGSATGINQRPNACDTTQLALIIFMLILIITVSIPVLMAASGNAEIEWITEKLAQLDENPPAKRKI